MRDPRLTFPPTSLDRFGRIRRRFHLQRRISWSSIRAPRGVRVVRRHSREPRRARVRDPVVWGSLPLCHGHCWAATGTTVWVLRRDAVLGRLDVSWFDFFEVAFCRLVARGFDSLSLTHYFSLASMNSCAIAQIPSNVIIQICESLPLHPSCPRRET